VWTTVRSRSTRARRASFRPAEMRSRCATMIPAVIERLEENYWTIAARSNAQGRCHVALERTPRRSPAMMDERARPPSTAAGAAFAGGK